MISKARELEIRRAAREVICDQQIFELPISPQRIARNLDIELVSWTPNSPGVSGFLMMIDGKFAIGYSNAFSNQGFENFTISHELGHYFLDGHPEELLNNPAGRHVSKSGFVSSDRFEREADLFASELLMPGSMVQKAINSQETGMSAVKEIARLCETSLTASAIKYAQISPDPVCVLLSEGKEICWATTSSSLQTFGGFDWIEKNSPLPTDSCTADFNSNVQNVSSGRENARETNWCRWFAQAPSIAAYEETKGLGDYGRTLSVISSETFPNSQQEHEDEQEVPDNYLDRWKRGIFRNRKTGL